MLKFDTARYNQALDKLGLKAEDIYPYQELLASEIKYINSFLYYLDNEDVIFLQETYDEKKFKHHIDEVSQEKLRYIYNGLKAIRERQHELLTAFYQPSPRHWQETLSQLFSNYSDYITLVHKLRIPSKVDARFKLLQEEKMNLGPQTRLDTILLAPIQRFPRYGLLCKDILACFKENESNKGELCRQFIEELKKFKVFIDERNEALNLQVRKYEHNQSVRLMGNLKSKKGKISDARDVMLPDMAVFDETELRFSLARYDFSSLTEKELGNIESQIEGKFRDQYHLIILDKVVRDKLVNFIRKKIEKKSKSKINQEQLHIYVYLLQALTGQETDNIKTTIETALREIRNLYNKEDKTFNLDTLKCVVNHINHILHKNHISEIDLQEVLTEEEDFQPSWDEECPSPYLNAAKQLKPTPINDNALDCTEKQTESLDKKHRCV